MSTYVEFKVKLDGHDSEHLTDAQWLFLLEKVTDNGPWGFSMPERAGEPVRVLAPGRSDHVFRCDADGSRFLEPWHPGERSEAV